MRTSRFNEALSARLSLALSQVVLCGVLGITGEAWAKPSGEAAYAAAHPKREGEVRVHFIDIGQGDSALIEGPTGKRVLIDSGPSQSGGALKAYLRAVGATELDMMINTHPHADHIGNAAALVREMTVRLVLDSGFAHPIKQYRDLLDAVEETKTPIRIARRGRSIDIGGGASLELLGPEEPLISGSRSDPNSNSVVFRLTFGGQSALFTGDAEEETEERLLKTPERLRAGLLKVAHHGSRHASGDHFLDAVSPVAAVISCSDRNRYGHPAPETLGRLERRGVRHWVTALSGSLVAETDGRVWRLNGEVVGGASARAGQAAHTQAAHTQAAPKQQPPKQASAADGRVNINTATAGELQALPGIGATLAQRILEERASGGPFSSAQDLRRVRGVGPKTIEKLAPLIRF